MTKKDIVWGQAGRLLVAFFVGVNKHRPMESLRSGAARYGAGLYTDGTDAGARRAEQRLLRAAISTMHLLETGDYQKRTELFAEWPLWDHVCLLEADRYSDGRADGSRDPQRGF